MLPPPVQKKLEDAVRRHMELEERLADAETLANPSLYRTLSRERGQLSKLVSHYRQYEAVLEEIRSSRELAEDGGDPELQDLAREELERLEAKAEELKGELLDAVLSGDVADRDGIPYSSAGPRGDAAARLAADRLR